VSKVEAAVILKTAMNAETGLVLRPPPFSKLRLLCAMMMEFHTRIDARWRKGALKYGLSHTKPAQAANDNKFFLFHSNSNKIQFTL
jgi:hypothetical protein